MALALDSVVCAVLSDEAEAVSPSMASLVVVVDGGGDLISTRISTSLAFVQPKKYTGPSSASSSWKDVLFEEPEESESRLYAKESR